MSEVFQLVWQTHSTILSAYKTRGAKQKVVQMNTDLRSIEFRILLHKPFIEALFTFYIVGLLKQIGRSLYGVPEITTVD